MISFTKKQQKKYDKILKEFESKKLTSRGKIVTNPKQAVAIAIGVAKKRSKK